MLVAANADILVVDVSYYEAAMRSVASCQVRCAQADVIQYISTITMRMGLHHLLFSPSEISYEQYHQILAIHKRLKLIPYPGLIEKLREIKSLEELRQIRDNVATSDRILLKLIKSFKPGMAELEVKAAINVIALKEGIEEFAFDTMVLSSARTSCAHGFSENHNIKSGDLVLIDFGIVKEGYCTDFCRSFVVGKATAKQRKYYNIVKEALEGAINKVKPGQRLRDVDLNARRIFSRFKLDSYFFHPIGHGIGLAVHELPSIDPENERIIEQGMVFSIEPGIYIPSWGGIRIEEMIEVESEGARILSSIPWESIDCLFNGGL